MVKKKVVKKTKKKISKKVKTEMSGKKVAFNAKDLKWNSDMDIGEETIDSQHKDILNEIKKCIVAVQGKYGVGDIRRLIDTLNKKIKEHFEYEEIYLEKRKYSDFKKHKKMHFDFQKDMQQLQDNFWKEYLGSKTPDKIALKYARKLHELVGMWFVEHISVEDKKFVKKGGLIKKEAFKKLEKKHTAEEASKKSVGDRSKFDVAAIAREIKGEIQKQREPVAESLKSKKLKPKEIQGFKGKEKEYVFTGVSGFDELLEQGIPKGNQLLVAGGAGSGKTIFCLQTLVNKAREGKKCLVMSLEENENKLIQHMEDFGWDAKSLIKKGNLKLMRINPFDITRNVDALLAKQKGELLIDINPVILPEDFTKPDFIVIDSLTAIASAFTGKDESYRIYIEQLFRFLERIGATGFLITETEQIPKIFSPTGVEEFLADGVIVLYNIKHGNVRENALEILKLRGASHQKKIVAMQITGEGIMIYPEQEVFSDLD